MIKMIFNKTTLFTTFFLLTLNGYSQQNCVNEIEASEFMIAKSNATTLSSPTEKVEHLTSTFGDRCLNCLQFVEIINMLVEPNSQLLFTTAFADKISDRENISLIINAIQDPETQSQAVKLLGYH